MKASLFLALVSGATSAVASLCLLKILGGSFTILSEPDGIPWFFENLAKGRIEIAKSIEWKLAVLGFALTIPLFFYLLLESVALSIGRIRNINFNLHPAFVWLLSVVVSGIMTAITPIGFVLQLGWMVFLFAAPTDLFKSERNKNTNQSSNFDSSQLQKLYQMKQEGILTDDEFARAKNKVLKDAA